MITWNIERLIELPENSEDMYKKAFKLKYRMVWAGCIDRTHFLMSILSEHKGSSSGYKKI